MHNWVKVIGEVCHSDEHSYVLPDYFYCEKCMRCMTVDEFNKCGGVLYLSCIELQIENILHE